MQMIRNSGMILCVLIGMVAAIITACTEPSPLTARLPDETEFHILKLQEGTVSLKKIVPVSQWVTQKVGGELILDYKGNEDDDDYENENENEDDDVEVKISLKVFSGTISQDAELMLQLDDQNLDLSFTPHGITFSEPALLNIEAKNLDLLDVPAELNVYYDNPETGQWQMMESDEVIVDQDAGYVKIIDTKIPHFSRYAIGWGELQ